MILIGSDVMLSVIVPVYNVEKHLKSCIDSILKNKTDAYEIILVDDGSTDGSPAICDMYEKRYGHISLIRQENSGPACARNNGIDAAQGRYITFIDSDDYVDEGYIDEIAAQIGNNDDILIFPMWIDDLESGSVRKQESQELPSVSVAQAVIALETAGFFNMACSKVYRREMLLREPAAYFRSYTEPGEDLLFNCDCFLKADSVSILDRPFYHWIRRGEDTLANRFRRDLYEKNQMFIENRNRLYRGLGLDQTAFPLLAKGNLAYIFACIPNMYRGKNKFPRRERISFYREIIASEEVAGWMDAAPLSGSLMKQFRRLYRTKSAMIMDAYYSAALWGRRRFDKLWHKIRKRMKT